jgi:hypothetical protein
MVIQWQKRFAIQKKTLFIDAYNGNQEKKEGTDKQSGLIRQI